MFLLSVFIYTVDYLIQYRLTMSGFDSVFGESCFLVTCQVCGLILTRANLTIFLIFLFFFFILPVTLMGMMQEEMA